MNNLLSVKHQILIIRRLCAMFGVRVVVDCMLPSDVLAYAHMDQNLIAISEIPKTRDCLVSVLMHEICHILATRQGKYKTFHSTKRATEYTLKDVISIQKTAVNAEVYVDVWAEKLTKMYFPDVVYEQSYRTKEDRVWKKQRIDKWVSDFKSYLR